MSDTKQFLSNIRNKQNAGNRLLCKTERASSCKVTTRWTVKENVKVESPAQKTQTVNTRRTHFEIFFIIVKNYRPESLQIRRSSLKARIRVLTSKAKHDIRNIFLGV